MFEQDGGLLREMMMEERKRRYAALMGNATFALIPGGDRATTTRFLEAFAFGCVPVVLTDRCFFLIASS